MTPDRRLLQPYSMENRQAYLHRFLDNAEMTELFSDRHQRREMAVDLFETKWLKASATVTRRDGTRFFIN